MLREKRGGDMKETERLIQFLKKPDGKADQQPQWDLCPERSIRKQKGPAREISV